MRPFQKDFMLSFMKIVYAELVGMWERERAEGGWGLLGGGETGELSD